jgi:hypothetical protein
VRLTVSVGVGLALFPAVSWAWGQEGHSIIAEIAQRRLLPRATAEIGRLLGPNHSLASVGSWADDVRDSRPETYRWHFVDIPIAEFHYDAAKHCAAEAGGDCIVAELERLRNELRCAPTDNQKQEALKFAVHFVGDVHQPLHTVDEARGGNDIAVEVKLRGALRCREGPCPMLTQRSNFHRVWDTTLINRTTWNWGAYVDRLESGWLQSTDAQGNAASGTIVEWAESTHASAQTVWNLLPRNHVLDDGYYHAVQPILDRQLGLAGLRLARFLNEAYESNSCPRH